MTDEDGKIAQLLWCIIMVLVRFDIYLVWGFETTVAAMLQRSAVYRVTSGDILCNHYDPKWFGNGVFDILIYFMHMTFMEAIFETQDLLFWLIQQRLLSRSTDSPANHRVWKCVSLHFMLQCFRFSSGNKCFNASFRVHSGYLDRGVTFVWAID